MFFLYNFTFCCLSFLIYYYKLIYKKYVYFVFISFLKRW